MDIGLIDVDGHNFPNIALMKISAYHKAMGNNVSWYNPLFSQDKVYASKVFTFTPDYKYIHCDKVERGGTGYDLRKTLPPEIDNAYPDYSLYKITDTAYGYLTRGCPRKCPFCVVSEKEGDNTYQAYKLSQFWNGQKRITLLDPNITAAQNCLDLFAELADTGAVVNFTQGLDLRLLNDEKTEALLKIKMDVVNFAWDNPSDEKIITTALARFIKISGYSYRGINVYVLVNYNTDLEQDLNRIYKIRDIGANPYVMIYNKQQARKEIRNLQRWCNNRFIFRSSPKFEEYNRK